MDTITVDLLSACDLVLRHCHRPDDTWTFESGSEAHIALADAVTQARIALGIDRPEMPATCKKEVAA